MSSLCWAGITGTWLVVIFGNSSSDLMAMRLMTRRLLLTRAAIAGQQKDEPSEHHL
jgi:hypothetical protein